MLYHLSKIEDILKGKSLVRGLDSCECGCSGHQRKEAASSLCSLTIQKVGGVDTNKPSLLTKREELTEN